MIVMKFGGTSNRDAGAMSNVIRIIQQCANRSPVVVISAIAEATNMLERAAALASEGKVLESRDIIATLFARHTAIADRIIRQPDRRAALERIMHAFNEELQELVSGVGILRELTPRTLDQFCAFGELLSSRLVAAGLEEAGTPAQWLDTREFLVTDENHGAALPMMDIVEQRLQALARPLVDRSIVPVTQGFIGVTPSGHRSTMGRESSDFSASIIGAALRCEEIQIWTDVDGILTGDPRLVEAPRKIDELSFGEAFELAVLGAKVLHPNTMLPAIERSIPVRILNSGNPSGSGTLVTCWGKAAEPAVKSVTYKRDAVLMSVAPRRRQGQYVFWDHVHSILSRHGITTTISNTLEHRLSLVTGSGARLAPVIHALGEIAEVEMMEHRGVVSLVGSGIMETPRFADRVFPLLAGCHVSMVCTGPSKASMSIVMDDAGVPDAVRRFHSEFFGVSGGHLIAEAVRPAHEN